MIIIPHMLVGAAIGVHSKSIGAAFLFGVISHYLIDFIPHWEYLDSLKIKKTKEALKIFLDFLIACSLVLFLVWDYPEKMIIIGFAIFGSLLPDFLIFIYINFKLKFLKTHQDIHHKIHYFKDLSFWQGLPTTLVVIIISILLII